MDRRTFLLTAAAAAAGCSRPDKNEPLRKAAQWLWSQQAADGGFHSQTYGLLRSGQSLTPFVLDALGDLGREDGVPAPSGGIDRGLAFIRKNTNADGALGMMDSATQDYPNYATALAVTAFVEAGRPGWERDIAPMVAHLRVQQFTEDHGWKHADPPFGGWGMGGPIHRPPDAGHVDLSMTRFVLEALRDAGVPSSDPALQRALAFLERCQNPDGGFSFSTVNLETNKAGETNGRPNSYGTTTADGLLALRAAGVADTDPRAAGAMKWLLNHHQPDRAPGFDGSPRQSWAAGLRFYYAAAIKRAMPSLPVQLPPQRDDGSFVNSSNQVKEDDPLIATGFALRALVQ